MKSKKYRMNTVKVNKEELLEKLTSNRLEHIEIYKEACEGYHADIIKTLERKLEKAKEDIDTKMYFSMSKPSSNIEEYDTAIAMLEMSVDDEVELTAEQFSCYVLDKWSWMNRFLEANAGYSGLASTKFLG